VAPSSAVVASGSSTIMRTRYGTFTVLPPVLGNCGDGDSDDDGDGDGQVLEGLIADHRSNRRPPDGPPSPDIDGGSISIDHGADIDRAARPGA
jgi:hypothetical protein